MHLVSRHSCPALAHARTHTQHKMHSALASKSQRDQLQGLLTAAAAHTVHKQPPKHTHQHTQPLPLSRSGISCMACSPPPPPSPSPRPKKRPRRAAATRRAAGRGTRSRHWCCVRWRGWLRLRSRCVISPGSCAAAVCVDCAACAVCGVIEGRGTKKRNEMQHIGHTITHIHTRTQARRRSGGV